jgi:hypothetical protein
MKVSICEYARECKYNKAHLNRHRSCLQEENDCGLRRFYHKYHIRQVKDTSNLSYKVSSYQSHRSLSLTPAYSYSEEIGIGAMVEYDFKKRGGLDL